MNSAIQNPDRGLSVLSYCSLFTSVSTLLCCALPSLLVLFGLGASVASLLSFMPWLVTLSRHKGWTFSIAGMLIAFSFINTYFVVPRLKTSDVCAGDNPAACRETGRMSKVSLWASAVLFSIGLFVAYVLGPILTRLDQ